MNTCDGIWIIVTFECSISATICCSWVETIEYVSIFLLLGRHHNDDAEGAGCDGTNLCRRVDDCQIVAIEQRAAERGEKSSCQERLREGLQEQRRQVRRVN